MNKKTPVSVLTEFCAQNKVPLPEYESVNQDRNPNVFEILVYAFKIMAKGSGRSKCEAKHAASQALLGNEQHLILIFFLLKTNSNQMRINYMLRFIFLIQIYWPKWSHIKANLEI